MNDTHRRRINQALADLTEAIAETFNDGPTNTGMAVARVCDQRAVETDQRFADLERRLEWLENHSANVEDALNGRIEALEQNEEPEENTAEHLTYWVVLGSYDVCAAWVSRHFTGTSGHTSLNHRFFLPGDSIYGYRFDADHLIVLPDWPSIRDSFRGWIDQELLPRFSPDGEATEARARIYGDT